MLRRNLMKGIFAGVLLVRAGFASTGPSEHTPVNAILRLFSSPVPAGDIGRIYLENNPGEQGTAYLTDRIFAGWNRGQRHHALSRPAVLKEMLARQCRRDFHAGRVSTVDGWVLSHTELRLYAVAHLAG